MFFSFRGRLELSLFNERSQSMLGMHTLLKMPLIMHCDFDTSLSKINTFKVLFFRGDVMEKKSAHF